jgi:threonine dehydrogenase-like Zn-dependent dehydrogenase
VTKSGGKLILVGYVPGTPHALDTMMMQYREYSVTPGSGSRQGQNSLNSSSLWNKEDPPLVTKTLPFDQVNKALEALKR